MKPVAVEDAQAIHGVPAEFRLAEIAQPRRHRRLRGVYRLGYFAQGVPPLIEHEFPYRVKLDAKAITVQQWIVGAAAKHQSVPPLEDEESDAGLS